jgi:hypothetical protein
MWSDSFDAGAGELLPAAEGSRRAAEETLAELAGIEQEDTAGVSGEAVLRLRKLRLEQAAIHKSAHAHPQEMISAGQVFAEGGEAWIDPWTDGRVLKRSKACGYVLGWSDDRYRPGLQLVPATPGEQINRHAINRRVFGDTVKFAGFTKGEEGKPTLAFSQVYIDGGEPTPDEVDRFMESAGFEKVPGDKRFAEISLRGRTWIDRDNRLVVTDAKPVNFKKQENGIVQAIDLVTQVVDDDRLWNALIEPRIS